MKMAEEIVYLEVDGEKLLPCPFCGSDTAAIYMSGNGWPNPNDYNKPSKTYTVECMTCGIGNRGFFYSPKEALQAWNRREQDSSRFCSEEVKHEEKVYERQMVLFQENE